jgi:hypothetical protein
MQGASSNHFAPTNNQRLRLGQKGHYPEFDPQYAHWRRVKRGLPSRYRLFHRFSSKPVRVVVYVWLNDEATLRKAGAKTDVYTVFQRMLARGEVPSGIDALTKRSAAIEE